MRNIVSLTCERAFEKYTRTRTFLPAKSGSRLHREQTTTRAPRTTTYTHTCGGGVCYVYGANDRHADKVTVFQT